MVSRVGSFVVFVIRKAGLELFFFGGATLERSSVDVYSVFS